MFLWNIIHSVVYFMEKIRYIADMFRFFSTVVDRPRDIYIDYGQKKIFLSSLRSFWCVFIR